MVATDSAFLSVGFSRIYEPPVDSQCELTVDPLHPEITNSQFKIQNYKSLMPSGSQWAGLPVS